MLTTIAPFDAAPQHGPRPLPLFLDMVRDVIASDPKRAADILAGVTAYQSAERIVRTEEMPIVAATRQSVLRDYGGTGQPVLFIPSLINPPLILDIAPHNSMLRWFSQHGVRPLLVDWGCPATEDGDLDIAGHVERRLLPLIDQLGETPAMVGYCLGGTMAIAAAMLRPPPGLALMATPWHFSGFPAAARTDIAGLWLAAAQASEAMRFLPMEVLQAAFWRLDPNRTMDKFATFGRLAPDSDAARSFVAIEDWANGGAPLTYAAGRDLFERFFGADVTGGGAWQVGGRTIDPAALQCPVLDIVSTTDRIVPAAAATNVGEPMPLNQGHVGMVVGGSARERLWHPLLVWLSRLRHS